MIRHYSFLCYKTVRKFLARPPFMYLQVKIAVKANAIHSHSVGRLIIWTLSGFSEILALFATIDSTCSARSEVIIIEVTTMAARLKSCRNCNSRHNGCQDREAKDRREVHLLTVRL